MPNPEYLPASYLSESRAFIRSLADEWADLPVSVPADIEPFAYADPAPPPRRSSRPLEDFVPTPPAYDFEFDPRNTYDH